MRPQRTGYVGMGGGVRPQEGGYGAGMRRRRKTGMCRGSYVLMGDGASAVVHSAYAVRLWKNRHGLGGGKVFCPELSASTCGRAVHRDNHLRSATLDAHDRGGNPRLPARPPRGGRQRGG